MKQGSQLREPHGALEFTNNDSDNRFHNDHVYPTSFAVKSALGTS